MQKINFNDIDFSSLKKLAQQGNTSTIYTDGTNCFKILDKFYDEEKELLYKKLLNMDGINIPNVLLPKELIIKNNKLQGYSMDYLKDSIPLLDRFMTRYVDCKELFDYVTKASNILKKIHQNNIICQDLSFENILVDKQDNISFCDLDGCSFGEHISPFLSQITKRFLIDYRKEEKVYLSPNIDRISMMISFYYLIYLKELQKLTKKQYNKLSKEIVTLENLREFANILVDKNNSINEIPYLDEVINPNDDYIIDRKNQLNIIRRILRR